MITIIIYIDFNMLPIDSKLALHVHVASIHGLYSYDQLALTT